MQVSSKPRVYISYTWLDGTDQTGRPGRVPDKRAEDLAEELRKVGIDARLDVYYRDNRYRLEPPQPVPGDPRDPWNIWQEEQIRDADCVLMLCTREYVESDPDHGACPGDWCGWHNGPDSFKVSRRWPGVWWDWHYIARELESPGSADLRKFIPVGFGLYHDDLIPAFVRGATYYNLQSTEARDALVRRIKAVFRKRHPRQGVFISYAHDDRKWLQALLTHLASLQQQGVRIWTDQEIAPGDLWHEKIQDALSDAQVAVLLVTPDFLASPYIQSNELPELLEAAESEGLVILWIPVRPSSWKESKLAPIQAAHVVSDPLSTLSAAKRDEAFVAITSRLRQALGLTSATQP